MKFKGDEVLFSRYGNECKPWKHELEQRSGPVFPNPVYCAMIMSGIEDALTFWNEVWP